MITETPDYLRLGLGMLGFSVCIFLALPESIHGQQISLAGVFFNITGFFQVFGQVMPAFWLRFRADIPVLQIINKRALLFDNVVLNHLLFFSKWNIEN